jgi:hypothetical protein
MNDSPQAQPPERIWLCPQNYEAATACGHPSDTEYIRADLVLRAAANDGLVSALATARADAIAEAIERIKAERLHENLDNESDKGYQNAIEHMVAALESLTLLKGRKYDVLFFSLWICIYVLL